MARFFDSESYPFVTSLDGSEVFTIYRDEITKTTNLSSVMNSLLPQPLGTTATPEFAKIGIANNTPIYEVDVVGDINFTGNLYQNGVIFEPGGGGSSFDQDLNTYDDVAFNSTVVGTISNVAYTLTEETSSFELELANMTAIDQVNDDEVFLYNLPFSFPYFGKTYTQLSICTNIQISLGSIQFDNGESWMPDDLADSTEYWTNSLGEQVPFIAPMTQDISPYPWWGEFALTGTNSGYTPDGTYYADVTNERSGSVMENVEFKVVGGVITQNRYAWRDVPAGSDAAIFSGATPYDWQIGDTVTWDTALVAGGTGGPIVATVFEYPYSGTWVKETSEYVKFTWIGPEYNTNNGEDWVMVSCILYANGDIRFQYGERTLDSVYTTPGDPIPYSGLNDGISIVIPSNLDGVIPQPAAASQPDQLFTYSDLYKGGTEGNVYANRYNYNGPVTVNLGTLSANYNFDMEGYNEKYFRCTISTAITLGVLNPPVDAMSLTVDIRTTDAVTITLTDGNNPTMDLEALSVYRLIWTIYEDGYYVLSGKII